MVKLIDKYGRKINYLRISVTDRCNLRCIYCVPNKGFVFKEHEKILRYEEIIKIAQAAGFCGINKIRITGGEPLIKKNIIYLIDSLIRTKGINDFSLTTNGTLLNEYAKDLKKVGLKRINISLDTLNKEKYRLITGSDRLDEVWRGINEAIEMGFNPIKINVVAMKNINDDEILEFARLTRDNPLHIRFIEYIPMGNNDFKAKEGFISNDEVKVYCHNLGRWKEEFNSIDSSVSSTYRINGAKGTISFISPVTKPFCSHCSRLRLTSDGRLRLCLGSAEEINLMSLLRTDKFSFDKLKQSFVFAAALKPKGHCFNFEPCISAQKTMCQIGG